MRTCWPICLKSVLPLDACVAALDEDFHFLQGCHGRIAGSCHGERAVGSSIFDSFLRIVELEKAIDKAAGKAITAADAIEDFQILEVGRFVRLSIRPANRSPVIP